MGTWTALRTRGAKCYLVDAGTYAATDMDVYKKLADNLRSAGLEFTNIDDCDSIDELLDKVGGVYLTQGLQSLRELADNSVDFIWSQAVLEHIRAHEFHPTMPELNRILKNDGIASHKIDLQDHLGGGLNNMRIPSRWWELDWMAASGFYTNRIRYPAMLSQFAAAGLQADVLGVDRWQVPPLSRSKLAAEFVELSEDDLCVFSIDVVLRKAREPERKR